MRIVVSEDTFPTFLLVARVFLYSFTNLSAYRASIIQHPTSSHRTSPVRSFLGRFTIALPVLHCNAIEERSILISFPIFLGRMSSKTKTKLIHPGGILEMTVTCEEYYFYTHACYERLYNIFLFVSALVTISCATTIKQWSISDRISDFSFKNRSERHGCSRQS